MKHTKAFALALTISLLLCGCSSADTEEDVSENKIALNESEVVTDAADAETDYEENADAVNSIRELIDGLDADAEGYGSGIKTTLIEKTKDNANYYYETEDGSLTFRVDFVQPDYATSTDEYAITLYVSNNTEDQFYIDASAIYAVSRIEGCETESLPPVFIDSGETKELCTTNSVIARDDGAIGLRFNNAQIVNMTDKTLHTLTDDYDDPYPMEITTISLT